METKHLSPAEILALGKLFNKKELDEARKEVLPGKYSVDFHVRIHGGFSVGEDFFSKTPNSIPWQKIALSLADRVNEDVLKSALKEAIGKEERKKKKEMVEKIFSDLTGATEQKKKGRVSTSLLFDSFKKTDED